MTDYIKRDAALACKQPIGAYGMDISSEDIKAIPAADVVEVKHGRWINPEDPTCYKCSVCGKYREQQWIDAPIFDKYCPNCGAKMDGGEDDAVD